MRTRITPLATPGELDLIKGDDGDGVVMAHPADRELAEWLASGSDMNFDQWLAAAGD